MTMQLQCSDGVILEVDVAVAKYSEALKRMVDTGVEDQIIVIPYVNSEIMKKVIEWASHHISENHPVFKEFYPRHRTEGSVDIAEELLTRWDTNFFNELSEETIINLTNAAILLDITGLVDMCCMTIAKQLVEKGPEAIRHAFGIEDDLSESDEEQSLV